MVSLQNLTRMSLTLGFITLIGLFFSHLALTDIYHNNEPNLNAEWGIVLASSVITVMFVILSSITMLRFIKNYTHDRPH